MQEIADELVASWLNGNLTYVIKQIATEQSQTRAALLSALIFSQLTTGDRTVFLRMLRERV
jgi:hypothetical protein